MLPPQSWFRGLRSGTVVVLWPGPRPDRDPVLGGGRDALVGHLREAVRAPDRVEVQEQLVRCRGEDSLEGRRYDPEYGSPDVLIDAGERVQGRCSESRRGVDARGGVGRDVIVQLPAEVRVEQVQRLEIGGRTRPLGRAGRPPEERWGCRDGALPRVPEVQYEGAAVRVSGTSSSNVSWTVAAKVNVSGEAGLPKPPW